MINALRMRPHQSIKRMNKVVAIVEPVITISKNDFLIAHAVMCAQELAQDLTSAVPNPRL